MPCSAMMREPLGVEIGQAEMADPAFLAQIGEVAQRVEIAPVAVIPPVELQQIETLRIHAATRNRDRFLDDAPCHRAGEGTHFVKAWISARRAAPYRAANSRRKAPMKSSAGP